MTGTFRPSIGTAGQFPASGLFATIIALNPESTDRFSPGQQGPDTLIPPPDWPPFDMLALDETDFMRVHGLAPVVDAVRDELRERFGEEIPVTYTLRRGEDAYLRLEAVVQVAGSAELLDAEEALGDMVLERFGFDAAIRVNVRLRRR